MTSSFSLSHKRKRNPAVLEYRWMDSSIIVNRLEHCGLLPESQLTLWTHTLPDDTSFLLLSYVLPSPPSSYSCVRTRRCTSSSLTSGKIVRSSHVSVLTRLKMLFLLLMIHVRHFLCGMGKYSTFKPHPFSSCSHSKKLNHEQARVDCIFRLRFRSVQIWRRSPSMECYSGRCHANGTGNSPATRDSHHLRQSNIETTKLRCSTLKKLFTSP